MKFGKVVHIGPLQRIRGFLNDVRYINPRFTYLLTYLPLKFRIFKKSRYWRPPSRKSQKSRYLRNRLTDVYEIWYADARWSPAPDVKFKFLIFDNLMWRTAATLRIEKLLKYIL